MNTIITLLTAGRDVVLRELHELRAHVAMQLMSLINALARVRQAGVASLTIHVAHGVAHNNALGADARMAGLVVLLGDFTCSTDVAAFGSGSIILGFNFNISNDCFLEQTALDVGVPLGTGEHSLHGLLDVLLDLGRLAHDVGDVVDLRQQQREEREAEHCDRDKADSAERGRNW